MNIWQWVTGLPEELREQGQERLASILETVPNLVCASRTEEACTLVDEGLALAREARLPWAAVYLRHWRLQDTLLRRLRVREYLSEAVDLLEYTSRDETRGCPQSVCATQDLVIAYAHVDAEGYAEERRAAAEETLARIDPSWPCFECLSGEYSDALVDGGDAAAALAFLDRQRDALVVAGCHVTQSYTLMLEDGSETLGFYGWLAASELTPVGEIHAFLEQATRELPTPLLWPKLAEAAGLPAAAARFREQMDELGITES